MLYVYLMVFYYQKNGETLSLILILAAVWTLSVSGSCVLCVTGLWINITN